MREAQQWEAALQGTAKAGQQRAQHGSAPAEHHDDLRSLATPHPASASSSEAAAWEAALSKQHGQQQQQQWRQQGRLVAAIEAGSHSSRLLITDGTTDADVVRTFVAQPGKWMIFSTYTSAVDVLELALGDRRRRQREARLMASGYNVFGLKRCVCVCVSVCVSVLRAILQGTSVF